MRKSKPENFDHNNNSDHSAAAWSGIAGNIYAELKSNRVSTRQETRKPDTITQDVEDIFKEAQKPTSGRQIEPKPGAE